MATATAEGDIVEGCLYSGSAWIRGQWEGKDWWLPKRPALTYEQWRAREEKNHRTPRSEPAYWDYYLAERARRYGVSGVGKTMSSIGVKVADLLGSVFQGIYHLDELMRVDWSNNVWIAVSVYGSLSSFDNGNLTRLVLEAHDRCLRLEISPHGPHRLELMFHERQREGSTSKRHPTMEEHIAIIRRGR